MATQSYQQHQQVNNEGDRVATHGTYGSQLPAVTGTIGTALTPSHETSAAAVAAQAKALVEARFLMALHRPRNWLDVRSKLLDACKRPGFAAIALYGIERKNFRTGQKVLIAGPSIRFAEEAARAMGNLLVDPKVTYDDAEKRIVQVMVTDLESNISWPTDVVISKAVERSRVYEGQTVLRARQNADGRLVYLVAATEDDIVNKQNAAVSKAARNGILRLLPGDIVDEAVEQVRETQQAEDQRDPQAALKRICDAFASVGVAPSALETYLGHALAQMTAPEREALRGIYTAIRDGQTTWADATASDERPAAPNGSSNASASSGRGGETLKDRVRQRATQPAGQPTAPAAATKPASEMTDEELLELDAQRAQQHAETDTP